MKWFIQLILQKFFCIAIFITYREVCKNFESQFSFVPFQVQILWNLNTEYDLRVAFVKSIGLDCEAIAQRFLSFNFS